MRNFLLAVAGYFFTMKFRSDLYETPALLLEECWRDGQNENMYMNRFGPFQASLGTVTACTHLQGFDEEISHFVACACKVGDRELVTSCDASPLRDGPLRLLDFGFLILVSIL